MCEKIKVCHICNLGMNGKAIFLCNLLEHTDFEKYDITILDYYANPSEAILMRIQRLPVEVVEPQNSQLGTFIKLLKKYLKNNHVDVVHSHIWDLSGIFLFFAKKYHVPVRVVHSHNTSKEPGRYNIIKEFVRDKLLWNILRYFIQENANRFAACSEEAAKWLFTDQIIQRKEYTIIANGIDLGNL